MIIIENIAIELGYSSQIGMPAHFKSLFSTLDFSLNKGGVMVSLNKRGDGIKAQHIPIILKFIANHYKSISGKAVINPDIIWGFEEPENNMEMGNTFKKKSRKSGIAILWKTLYETIPGRKGRNDSNRTSFA